MVTPHILPTCVHLCTPQYHAFWCRVIFKMVQAPFLSISREYDSPLKWIAYPKCDLCDCAKKGHLLGSLFVVWKEPTVSRDWSKAGSPGTCNVKNKFAHAASIFCPYLLIEHNVTILNWDLMVDKGYCTLELHLHRFFVQAPIVNYNSTLIKTCTLLNTSGKIKKLIKRC